MVRVRQNGESWLIDPVISHQTHQQPKTANYAVRGLAFGSWGLGIGLGRHLGLGLRVQGDDVHGQGARVWGPRFSVLGSVFKVEGVGICLSTPPNPNP